MTQPIEFRTDKIDKAAFLMSSGVPLARVEEETREKRSGVDTYIVKWFCFAESEVAASSPSALARTFDEGDPTVSVQTYLHNQRRCRDIAHGRR